MQPPDPNSDSTHNVEPTPSSETSRPDVRFEPRDVRFRWVLILSVVGCAIGISWPRLHRSDRTPISCFCGCKDDQRSKLFNAVLTNAIEHFPDVAAVSAFEISPIWRLRHGEFEHLGAAAIRASRGEAGIW